MKLLVITSLKEYRQKAAQILNQAKIEVFSVTETTGIKGLHDQNLLDNWFSSGDDQFDSIFIFSFTEPEKAEEALALIEDYNAENNTGFPMRAFILPVEMWSTVKT